MDSRATVDHLEPRNHPEQATGFTLFFLVYGAEAALPTDLEYRSPRLRGYEEESIQRAREDSLDQIVKPMMWR
jgi:hypothetical protein